MHSVVVPIASSDIIYDLTTVEDVNAELGIGGDSAADAITADEITSYSKLVAEICDRVFAQQSVVENFRLYEHRIHALPLSRYPVSEITSVTVNNTPLAEDVDYELNPENGLLWRINGHWGFGRIVVEYTGGYDLPGGAPSSLARAVIELIEDARVSGERDVSIRDIQHGDRRVSYFNANVSGSNASLPASVADLIKPFKRIVVA